MGVALNLQSDMSQHASQCLVLVAQHLKIELPRSVLADEFNPKERAFVTQDSSSRVKKQKVSNGGFALT